MKKFINQVELVEDQMIAGMVKAYPQYVRKLDCGNVVVRTEKKEGKGAETIDSHIEIQELYQIESNRLTRRLRRHGHAGRGGRGRGVHLSHAGPDL